MGSEWTRCKLGELFLASNQGVNTTTEKVVYSVSGIKVIRAKNVSPYQIDYSDVVHVDKHTFDTLRSPVKPRKGDVLYTNIGSQLGSAATVSSEEEVAIAWNVFRIAPKKELIDSGFLVSFLNNPVTREYVRNLDSSSTMPFVSGKVFRDISIFLPPISEQKNIAHVLGSLNSKIQLNRQTNETLEKMAQALFKSWFVDFDPVIDNALEAGNTIPDELQDRAERRKQQLAKPDHQPLPDDIRQLFPSEFELTEELGWVPMGWEIKPLDKIAHYQNGLAMQKFRPDNESQFLPVLKIAQLKKGATDGKEKAATDIKPSCIVDNGDIVFSWSGSLMVDIWCGGKAALNQHLFKVTSKNFPRWYCYLFTVHYLVEFQRIAADKAVTMGHIKREHLSQAKCVVPPGSLLAAGTKHIESFIKQQITLRIKSKQLEELRDTLLPKLISGELRLP